MFDYVNSLVSPRQAETAESTKSPGIFDWDLTSLTSPRQAETAESTRFPGILDWDLFSGAQVRFEEPEGRSLAPRAGFNHNDEDSLHSAVRLQTGKPPKHEDAKNSSGTFEDLRTHMMALEAAVGRLLELERENEVLKASCKKITLAHLMKTCNSPEEVKQNVKMQLNTLEGQEDAVAKAKQFAIQSSQEIHRLCPEMRASLDREMTVMIAQIYETLYSAKDWSRECLAQRTNGRIPSPDRIEDIVADVNILLTWRALSLKQEKYCKVMLKSLQARKLQLRILHLLEINLMMASTHHTTAALIHDADLIKSFVDGLYDPYIHGWRDLTKKLSAHYPYAEAESNTEDGSFVNDVEEPPDMDRDRESLKSNGEKEKEDLEDSVDKVFSFSSSPVNMAEDETKASQWSRLKTNRLFEMLVDRKNSPTDDRSSHADDQSSRTDSALGEEERKVMRGRRRSHRHHHFTPRSIPSARSLRREDTYDEDGNDFKSSRRPSPTSSNGSLKEKDDEEVQDDDWGVLNIFG